MTCKLQPSVVPYRFTLRGGGMSAAKIEVSADVKNLTSLLKDEQLVGYIRAVCVVNISEKNIGVVGMKIIDETDISSGVVDFDVNLSTMLFNWWDSFTDIWCETYISVDTQQMSEDYGIVIPEEYRDMKGEVIETYIFQGSDISNLVVDEREDISFNIGAYPL